MLVVPSSATVVSTVPHALTNIPISRGSVSISSLKTLYGCGNDSVVVAPSFNSTSGVFLDQQLSSSKGCGTLYAGSTTSYLDTGIRNTEYSVQFSLPSTINGSHTFYASWVVRPSVTIGYHPGVCTPPAGNVSSWGCASYASVSFVAHLQIMDKKSHKVIAESYTVLSNGVGNSTSYNYPNTTYRNVTNMSRLQYGTIPQSLTLSLNSSHNYVLLCVLDVSTVAGFSSGQAVITGGHASAGVQLTGSRSLTELKSLLYS